MNKNVLLFSDHKSAQTGVSRPPLWVSLALIRALRAALLLPLSRGFLSRVAPARLGQEHEPVLRTGWPAGSHRAARTFLPAVGSSGNCHPAGQGASHHSHSPQGPDQNRGQSGPGDARELSGSTHVSADPLTHGVLFHTRSKTCVCKPHGLRVCLSKVFSPVAAAHTCPRLTRDSSHLPTASVTTHIPPETGRGRTVRITFYV